MSEAPAAERVASEQIPGNIRSGLGPEQLRGVRRSLTALGVLGTGSMLGGAFSLYLVNHWPLLLIGLSPIGRHLVLVAPTVNPFAFIAVGATRRLLFYLASFHLGRALGPAGLEWLERRWARAGRFIRWLERLFAFAPRTAVFFLPGPAMSTIAGTSGMAPRVFTLIAAGGLVLRMVTIIYLAEWFREPIEWLLAWVEVYWVPGTIVLVTGIAIHQYVRWRRRRS
jgi:membrane protein DedA with SNARE-associated domain